MQEEFELPSAAPLYSCDIVHFTIDRETEQEEQREAKNFHAKLFHCIKQQREMVNTKKWKIIQTIFNYMI